MHFSVLSIRIPADCNQNTQVLLSIDSYLDMASRLYHCSTSNTHLKEFNYLKRNKIQLLNHVLLNTNSVGSVANQKEKKDCKCNLPTYVGS